MYYLACARQLAWGYVDHPPLSILILRVWVHMFTESEIAVRSLGALISLGTILAIGRLTAKLGGSRPAIALAGLCFAASPVMQVTGLLYSPNTLDPLMWALSTLAWLSCLEDRRSAPKWAILGATLGLAFLNRLSGAWLIFSLCLGTAFAGSGLTLRGPLLCCATLLAFIAPWVLWQAQNHWATVEFVRNANAHKLNPVGPLQFALTQLAVTNIVAAPVWITGLVDGLRKTGTRRLAVAFCAVVAILLLNGRSRENYLAPAYVFVIPIGAIVTAEFLGKARTAWYAAAIVLSGAAFCLVCLPILPKETLARVLSSLPTPPSAEKGPKSVLQGLSDTIGWQQISGDVAKVWNTLPVADRARAAVITANYGEASALLRFGPALGMPEPISGHNQFWLWGPGQWDGRCAILVGVFDQQALGCFEEVRIAGRADAPWATPEESHAPIRIAYRLKVPVHTFWNRLKRFE
jgi:hypothetical protein